MTDLDGWERFSRAVAGGRSSGAAGRQRGGGPDALVITFCPGEMARRTRPLRYRWVWGWLARLFYFLRRGRWRGTWRLGARGISADLGPGTTFRVLDAAVFFPAEWPLDLKRFWMDHGNLAVSLTAPTREKWVGYGPVRADLTFDKAVPGSPALLAMLPPAEVVVEIRHLREEDFE